MKAKTTKTYSEAKANLAKPNRFLKKILARIDGEKSDDRKALYIYSYPKYATEILLYIAGV